MVNEKKLTPLMQQYWEVKNQHPDKIILFRMGDFFEMFHEDAKIAAPILNIALTQRNKKSNDDTPMCGVPHHSIEGPIGKLLDAGYKIAICDQVEDPKLAKGLVKRAVTRCLSPGMVWDPSSLDEQKGNYLACYIKPHLAFFDATTYEAFYFRIQEMSQFHQMVELMSPIEWIVEPDQKSQLRQILGLDSASFSEMNEDGWMKLKSKFENMDDWPKACQLLLSYAVSMQGEELMSSVGTFKERPLQNHMVLSPTVVRHLEIFETYRGEKRGSLFSAIQRTKTSGGTRRLRQWLSFPSTDIQVIQSRQKQISFWMDRLEDLKNFRQCLSGIGDMERRLGKVAHPNCHPRDVLSLTQSVMRGLSLSQWVRTPNSLVPLRENSLNLVERVLDAFVEELPPVKQEFGLFKRGYHGPLDELIDLSENSNAQLMELEAKERELTGIPSLKIKYNNVFGYYIEVTNTHRRKVPTRYIRKQTLTNAERYSTPELSELEEKVLSAKSRRVQLEKELFDQIRTEFIRNSRDILKLGDWWNDLDVYSSLAWLSMEQNYHPPRFGSDQSIELIQCRHPVVEQAVEGPFVANDIKMKAGQCLLLTGPNMAGKSTIMRQVAVIQILAQMGSLVPAKSCCLPLISRIFTRIGASDYLAEGLSTFMVEMKETAEMLKGVSERDLVILDEVGRGTSTYDGMSLAQAILEFLVKDKKCLTFFATHYHELTNLNQKYQQIINGHMSIEEKSDGLRFLYQLKSGFANKSYGIQVAKLAGLPKSVTQHAQKLLIDLENQSRSSDDQLQLSLRDWTDLDSSSIDDTLVESRRDVLDEIKNLSVSELTPLQALNQLAKWQQNLS